MNHGSTHVWMYDCSDDEFVSETELQEGMWLRWGGREWLV